MKTIGLLALLGAVGVSAGADEVKYPKCFNASREGRCFVLGRSAVTRSSVVQGNRLPAGKYLIEVRANGARANWDRQVLYLEVAP